MNNFIIAGMPRGGTTFLYHNLQRHPAIHVPFRKEVNYFNVNYDLGESWYRSLYKDAKPDQYWADVSPPCFLTPEADERILKFNPDTKIIISVRDPIDWSLSFYAQFKSFNYKMGSFQDYVNGYSYKTAGKSIQIEPQNDFVPKRLQQLQSRFGRNMLIYPQRMLKKNPVLMFNTIEDFLGIPRHINKENFDNRKINDSGRRNIVWLSNILNNEKVINQIYKLPRGVIVSLRKNFDSLSTNAEAPPYQHSPEDIALSKKLFSGQQEWVDALFKEHQFILGDGTPFTKLA
jgi:hypothetical protein